MAERLKQTQMDGSGTRVFKEWFSCSKCGLEVGAHDKYCRHCGEKLT